MNVEDLTGFLAEAEGHHATRHRHHHPKHHWSQWYAAYVDARRRGLDEDEACDHAGRYIEQEIRWP